jgi:hypothetical protein
MKEVGLNSSLWFSVLFHLRQTEQILKQPKTIFVASLLVIVMFLSHSELSKAVQEIKALHIAS